MSETTADRPEVAKRVQDIVALVLRVPPADAAGASRHTTEEWDSLKHVELMFAVEQSFDVEFSSEQMAHAVSTESLVNEVIALLDGTGA